MQISDRQKKIILSVLDFLCLLLVCAFIYKFISPYPALPMLFCGEGLFEPYSLSTVRDVNSSPLQIFLCNEHHLYLYSAVYVLTQRYLADFLQIHPSVYLDSYQKFLYFGFFILLLYSLLRNFMKYFPKQRFMCLLIPFAALFVLKPITDFYFLWILSHPAWCISFVFLPAFLFLFLSDVGYNYVNLKKPSKSELFLTVFLILVLSVSQGFHRFILCIGSITVLIVHKLVFKTEFNKKYLLFWVLIVFICSLNFRDKSFIGWLSERLIFNRHPEGCSVFTFQFLAQYFSEYFNLLIKSNVLYINLLALLLLFVHFFVNDKERNKRLYIYIFSLLFSVYLFFVVIILYGCSDISYQNQGLRLSVIYIFIYCILSVFGYLLKMSENKGLNIFMISFALLQFFTVFTIPDYGKVGLWQKNITNRTKKAVYLIEKMFVLYGKEHKKYYYIKVVDDIYDKSVIYLLDRYDKNSSIKNYEMIEVCEVIPSSETAEICYNKYIELIKEKTGYTVSKEELEKHDFSVFDEYSANYRKNIHKN